MRFLGPKAPKSALLVLVCASGFLVACGNSCFVAYSVNGTGGVIVKGGNPPPTCNLNQAQGMVRAAIVKPAVCESCAPVAQVQHMYLVLRGVQIHGDAGDGDSAGWVDIAPELAASPRQIDLVGDSLPELTIASAIVPAGTYDSLRLQFVSSTDAPANACGPGITNCLLLGNGRVEPLSVADEAPEVLIPLPLESNPAPVLPDTTLQLQIHLGARQLTGVSTSTAGEPPMRLIGQVVVQRAVTTN